MSYIDCVIRAAYNDDASNEELCERLKDCSKEGIIERYVDMLNRVPRAMDFALSFTKCDEDAETLTLQKLEPTTASRYATAEFLPAKCSECESKMQITFFDTEDATDFHIWCPECGTILVDGRDLNWSSDIDY